MGDGAGNGFESEAIVAALDTFVRERVAQEVARQLAEHEPSPDQSPWLSVREAAGYVGVSEGAMRQAIRRGAVPSFTFERRRLLRRQDLDDLLLRSASKSSPRDAGTSGGVTPKGSAFDA
jgi:excisionase family DNA binding protein